MRVISREYFRQMLKCGKPCPFYCEVNLENGEIEEKEISSVEHALAHSCRIEADEEHVHRYFMVDIHYHEDAARASAERMARVFFYYLDTVHGC